MTLRGFMLRVIWLCVAPLVLLAAYFALDSIRAAQSERELEAADLSRNAISAIDQSLNARIGGLQILAASPSAADSARPENLYAEAENFHRIFGSHVVVADPQMHMLLNTRVPLGTTLPRLPQPQGQAAAPTALRTGRPAVGDLFFGPVAHEPLVAIAVPAMRNGKAALVVLTVLETREFLRSLEAVALPQGWSLALLDGTGAPIARRGPARNPAAGDEQRFAARSKVSPWSVALYIPRAAYRAPVIRGAADFGITILVIAAVSALGGMLASRRLARSVRALADPGAPAAPRAEIEEFARVRRTLDEAQAARRESEDRYRDLVENSQDLFCTHDLEGRLISVNAVAYRTLGYEPGSLIGTNLRDVLSPGTRGQFAAYLDEIAAKGGASGQMAVQTRDGKVRYWEYHNTLRTEGVPAPIVRGMARDVTDAQLAGRALRESERRFRATFEQAAVGIAIVAPEGRWLQVNDKLCRIVGYSREEMIAGNFQSITHPEGVEGDLDAARRMLAGEIDTYRTEKRYLRKDGTTVWGNLTVALARHGDGSPAYFISVVEDIQDRKLAELALRAAEEQFRGLIDQSIAGIWVIQDGKFSFVNPRCVEIFGYESAAELVGLDPASVIAEQDRARVAALMRRRLEGEVPHESYEFTGLRKDGSTIDVGAHGARATYGGKPALVAILQDISEKRRAEEQIRDYVARLETAFMSTVEVATNLSEMRDPYTAGHERRVAEVAAAIGAELGFDGRRQEGLRVAGHLHDIGKIMVPAEILAKPGRLSAIEYQLIQGHPRAGHDALKDVNFPWPVAEVTLQHHERMDGSGYPQGLKGDAILLEARVLAVADVIEAMSSHRPYRPGLGTDAALAEVERGRGKVYDADVCDAALRLFREKGYRLPD